MKKAVKLLAVVFALVSIVMFSSCSKNEKNIVGAWKAISMSEGGQSFNFADMGMDMTYNFNEDGTGSINSAQTFMGQNVSTTMPFTYSVDGDQLTMTIEGETSNATIETLTKTDLVFVEGNNRMTLERK